MDLIERQAAIDALQKEINKGIPPFDDVMGSIRCGVRLARNIIEDLPSAEPNLQSNLQPTCNQLATDYISRQGAIDTFLTDGSVFVYGEDVCKAIVSRIKQLPSAKPEIIYCKNCKKHNMQHNHFYHGKYIGVKECCPLIFVRGLAQGHEFDYQFCAEAERRTDEGHDI